MLNIKQKQIIAEVLRRTRLLQFADTLLMLRDIARNWKANQLFLAAHPDFVPPPSHLAFDAYNHTNWQAYYEMGLNHSRLVADLLRKHLREKEIKLCEWGCGPARVIRHLARIEGFDKVGRYGADYNEKSIKWCGKYIPGVRFATNSLEPPLPYGPEMFDCVYAISIFTHLSEKMHYAWIQELFRTIKPKGILIFTSHGDRCALRLSPAEKARYDADQFVVKDRIKEGRKHFGAYHPRRFVRKVLLKDYRVLEHISDPDGYQLEQEVWVVGKGG